MQPERHSTAETLLISKHTRSARQHMVARARNARVAQRCNSATPYTRGKQNAGIRAPHGATASHTLGT
eukprot:4423512-Lingulodinium_polyedra.AAC.1